MNVNVFTQDIKPYLEKGINVYQILYRDSTPYLLPVASVVCNNPVHDSYGRFISGTGAKALETSITAHRASVPCYSGHMTFRNLCLYLWSMRVYDLPLYYYSEHGYYRIMNTGHGINYKFSAIRC